MVFSMTEDKGIFIKNIYYMLSYAFQVLEQSNYKSVASESFENAEDLFAAILAKGVAQQLKQGLYREYVTADENLSVMRGKINLSQTILNKTRQNHKIACEFDELSENNLFNQILKTTMSLLVKNKNVDAERKNMLKKELVFFDTVDYREPSEIMWSRLNYRRNNKSYEMLMSICYFVLEGLLQTTEEGEYKTASFFDDHMERLYERFILEYYKYHYGDVLNVSAAKVSWNLVGSQDEAMIKFLPDMQTDIMLRLKEKVLIIDAKYYGHILQRYYDKKSLHSGNIYQIFTYVKNTDKNNTGNTSGLLLYAKTNEEIVPDCLFNMGGNQIGAKTLDLNKDFKIIAQQLNKIAEDYFEIG